MRIIQWAFRAAVFFVLFAFALNNQHAVDLNWFFGFSSHAPMVLVVLVAFAAGAVVGVLAMLPGWWRQQRRTRALEAVVPRTQAPAVNTAAGPPADAELPHPPRDGV